MAGKLTCASGILKAAIATTILLSVQANAAAIKILQSNLTAELTYDEEIFDNAGGVLFASDSLLFDGPVGPGGVSLQLQGLGGKEQVTATALSLNAISSDFDDIFVTYRSRTTATLTTYFKVTDGGFSNWFIPDQNLGNWSLTDLATGQQLSEVTFLASGKQYLFEASTLTGNDFDESVTFTAPGVNITVPTPGTLAITLLGGLLLAGRAARRS